MAHHGASSGIGRSVTERLLEQGDRVAAFVRRPESLSELSRKYPGQLWVAPVDVTNTRVLRDAVDRAFADLGTIDVVFSNAGAGAFGAAEELDDPGSDESADPALPGDAWSRTTVEEAECQ